LDKCPPQWGQHKRLIAIVAWLFGAGGVAGLSAQVGRLLLFIFLILAIISIIVEFATNHHTWGARPLLRAPRK